MRRPVVSLNMIVKNEAPFIKPCLESVRDLISYWVICDTGSTDATPEIIRQQLRDIPGELHHDEWIGFAENRNLGLERGRGKAEWHLIMDADFTAEVGGEFSMEGWDADGYLLGFAGALDWTSLRLVSDRHGWKYRGMVHEFIESPTATRLAKLPGLTLRDHGVKRCDAERTQGYLKLLLREWEQSPGEPRIMFHLARTYRGLGQPEEAIKWLEKRLSVNAGGEEFWYAAYLLGLCKQDLDRPWPEVLHDLLQAYGLRPWRLEPLVQICRMYRKLRQFHLAHMFSAKALEVPYPKDDLLFIERSVYEYELLLEHAIACRAIGEEKKAAELCERVLQVPGLPEEYGECALAALRGG